MKHYDPSQCLIRRLTIASVAASLSVACQSTHPPVGPTPPPIVHKEVPPKPQIHVSDPNKLLPSMWTSPTNVDVQYVRVLGASKDGALTYKRGEGEAEAEVLTLDLGSNRPAEYDSSLVVRPKLYALPYRKDHRVYSACVSRRGASDSKQLFLMASNTGQKAIATLEPESIAYPVGVYADPELPCLSIVVALGNWRGDAFSVRYRIVGAHREEGFRSIEVPLGGASREQFLASLRRSIRDHDWQATLDHFTPSYLSQQHDIFLRGRTRQFLAEAFGSSALCKSREQGCLDEVTDVRTTLEGGDQIKTQLKDSDGEWSRPASLFLQRLDGCGGRFWGLEAAYG